VDSEELVFISNYPTHSETWHIVEDMNTSPPESELVIEGNDGKQYWVWHNFHHTREGAEKYFQDSNEKWKTDLGITVKRIDLDREAGK